MSIQEVIHPLPEITGKVFLHFLKGKIHHVGSFYKALSTSCLVSIFHRLDILHVVIDLDVIFIASLFYTPNVPLIPQVSSLNRSVILDLSLKLNRQINNHLPELSRVLALYGL